MVAMLHKRTTLTARDVMAPLLTLLPAELSVEAAVRILAMGGAASAPVVDEGGRLVGIFSATDTFRRERMPSETAPVAANADECMCQPWEIPAEPTACVCKVRDVMCRDHLPTATASDSLADIADAMIRMQVHKVIVVDADERPLGCVTSLDILAAACDDATPPGGGPHIPLKG